MSKAAFDAAVKLLQGRSKSRAKLEAGLRQRGHAEGEIAAALERVTELGYLNDTRHAEAKAKSAIAEGRSLADVQRRLQAEGIDEQTAAFAAQAAAKEAGYDELSSARALVAKRKLSGAKAARFLGSRGYSEDVIAKIVGNEGGEFP